MGVCNSQEGKFLLSLYEHLFIDLYSKFPEFVKSLRKDFSTLCDRFHAEGLPFLTKTLPSFGKAFDRSLDERTQFHVNGFASSPSGVPLFFRGLTEGCYDDTGILVSIPADRVQAIRQVCYLVYKYELPFCASVVSSTLETFEDVDREVGNIASQLCFYDVLIHEARHLIQRVVAKWDVMDITPRHGPGAVATGEKGEGKYPLKRVYRSLNAVYPFYDYFVVGAYSCPIDFIRYFKNLERHESGCAKVVLVPKDSRGPRLISEEPLEYQWIQQGIARSLMTLLESHSLTKGYVNFRDQDVNRTLALSSSESQAWATIDLKDASDRVSLKLVEMLFPEHIYKSLNATRSPDTVLPNGKRVHLNKFAPMGSALCFPVEAFVFWAVSHSAVKIYRRRMRQSESSEVYVYGDDIIVPNDCASVVSEALESVGLRVNSDKSFSSGWFRESCGLDAYRGLPVTPTRISTLWTEHALSPALIESYCAYAQAFWKKGYDSLSEHIYSNVERILKRRLPFGVTTSSYYCRHVKSHEEAELKNMILGLPYRYDAGRQRYKFLVLSSYTGTAPTKLDSWPRLLRNLTKPQFEPDKAATRIAKFKSGWEVV